MNKEEIRQALVKFNREDLLYGDNDIYLDDSVEVFLTISQMIKFKNQQKQIDQLTNNWNELEEWVKSKKNKNFFGYIDDKEFYLDACYVEMLDKMEEIKEGNNDKNQV